MEQFTKLTAKLSELFELEKADLDFGIHRIIKARQKHIRTFLGVDEAPAEDPNAPTLKKIVQRELGDIESADTDAQLKKLHTDLVTVFTASAFAEDGTISDPAVLATPLGKQYQELHTSHFSLQTSGGNSQLEASIYSHLTTFFSRYYDDADFISKRRIKAGAEPYAVPYSGEEVMLHWANKDQYYIKSSKDLKDYTFTLKDGKRVQFKCERQDPVLNNNNAKREFHLDDEAEIEVSDDAIVIPFHFKIVEKTRTNPQKAAFIDEVLTKLPIEWQDALKKIPEGSTNNLLTRHLNNYTRKNEADFFIHKHLGKFLRGELDFYIKNEVMHLDDIDEKSADYLTAHVRSIKAIRTIARYIIDFLAQLENFQKKLWLKKKYVTETHYCFTLDRILATAKADDLLATVLDHLDTKIRRYDGERRSQHDEWIKLYAIDELEDYPTDKKLTAEFLRAHDKLMLDTVFYPAGFKWQLLGAMEDLEEQLDGLLMHSDNFQALNLIRDSKFESLKCVYIDPPYNTSSSAIPYKNNYKHSSWGTLMADRLHLLRDCLSQDGAIFVSIDKSEQTLLEHVMDGVFGMENRIEELIWVMNTTNSQLPNYSTNHEYVEVYAKNRTEVEKQAEMFREPKPGYEEMMALVARLNPDYPPVSEIELEIKALFETHKIEYRESIDAAGLEWEDEKKNDPWKGLYNYSRAEYRDADGNLTPESEAAENNAIIWIWREDNTAMPAAKQADSTQDPEHINWRFYRPNHPVTGKPAPHPKSGWKFPFDTDVDGSERRTFKNLNADNRIAWGLDEKKVPQIKRMLHEVETNIGKSVFNDYSDGEKQTSAMFGQSGLFLAPKHSSFVSRFILQAAKCAVEVLDCFGGSGSTGQAVIDLTRSDRVRRKYIQVEVNDYFDTLLKPRLIKSAYATVWKAGKPLSKDGISHAFKYLRLESYEDALNNLDLGDDRSADLLGLGDSVREDYLFSYLLDVETRGHLMNLDRFRDPWGCQLKIHDPHTGKSEPRSIDLVETFNYLIGITIREVKVHDGFLTLEGENPNGDTILIIWRKLEGESDWQTTTNADLNTFVSEKLRINPADTEYHALYLNGDHTLSDPQSKVHCTEEVFYQRMFAHTGNPDD